MLQRKFELLMKSVTYITHILFVTKYDSQMTIWRACGQVLPWKTA